MLCRFYGAKNYQFFKLEWEPLAYYITTMGKIFNWAQIFSIIFKYAILQVHKKSTTKKPTFYLLTYVMDIICTSFSYPAMNWHWTKEKPLIHIYYLVLWEDNYIPQL